MLAVEKIPPGTVQKLIKDNDIVVGVIRPKMEVAKNGEFIKFFYDSGKIDSSSFSPKAQVFVRNAFQLEALGFVAPHISNFSYCPEESTWFVRYPRLPGNDLRELNSLDALEGLPGYLAQLHEKGVFFRGIHLGNILRNEDQFGLIDFVGMRIWPVPLNIYQRLRNIRRFVCFPEDQGLFEQYGVQRFCTEYCEAAGITGWRKSWLLRSVAKRQAKASAN